MADLGDIDDLDALVDLIDLVGFVDIVAKPAQLRYSENARCSWYPFG